MANPDDKGYADVVADTDGQGFVRIDGKYLAEALKAFGGMVDFSLASASSPMLFVLLDCAVYCTLSEVEVVNQLATGISLLK